MEFELPQILLGIRWEYKYKGIQTKCALYICILLKYGIQSFCHLARETNKTNVSILLSSSYEF